MNGTPGSRSEAATFSALPDDTIEDNRLGQFIFRFDTTTAGIPAGLGPENYDISNFLVTITVSQGGFRYDPSQDDWRTYSEEGLPDEDPGRPLELHGTGFRNGFTAATFQENSPFEQGTPLRNNAFAIDFDENGVERDLTNNVEEEFNPFPWAIGQIDGISPGALVPVDSVVNFRPDFNQPGVANYLREGLNQGFIWFTITSMHPALRQGGEFVAFYTKESIDHILDVEDGYRGLAPTLDLTCTIPSDFTSFSRDNSGKVSLEFIGVPNYVYTLQASSDLTANSWSDLETFSPTTPGILGWQASSPQPKRFFRISRTIAPSP